METSNKPSLKGACSGHVIHLNFWGITDISGTAEARVVICCAQVIYVKS